MSKPRGLRFSATDAVVLALGAVATWWLHSRVGTYAWLIAVALGHFFLFCNVFRIRRSYELIWAGIFAINFAAWLASGSFGWLGVLAVQAPVTIAVIVAEIRSDRYHGIWS